MTISGLCSGALRGFRRSLRRRGFWKTIPFLLYRSLRAFGYRRPPGISAFDRIHGTDTSSEVMLGGLAIDSPNVSLGIPYTPTPAEVFTEIFGAANIAWQNFIFIDFGSGKGLPMMLASDYPFRRIIGVEFAPELIRVAEENVRRYRSPTQRCTQFEFVCADAVEYPIPAEPAVFYFGNPFIRDVMQIVLARIEASLREHPREAWIVYVNPVEYRMFERSGVLEGSTRNAEFAIYRNLNERSAI